MFHSALVDVVTPLLVVASLIIVPISPDMVSGGFSPVFRVRSATADPVTSIHRLIDAVGQLVGPIVSLVLGLRSGRSPPVPTSPSAAPSLVPTSLIPVAVLLDISGELQAALAFPPWTGTVVKFAGLCTLLIGVMAWMSSNGFQRRLWGRRLAVSGAGLTIVGFAFDAFINMVKYVLAG